MSTMTKWVTAAALLAFTTVAYAAAMDPKGGNAAADKEAQSKPKAQSKQDQRSEDNRVVLQTSLGLVLIELYPEKAPLSVENFLQYVDDGFYEGVIFHRVVPNFVVQVGGFDAQYQRKPTRSAIKNESDNGLINLRGTLSMARTMSPDSATSQFFISLRDNPHLDGQGGPGYAVFGKVVEGMDVIDKMPELPQGDHSGVFMNAPNEPILIEKAYRLTQKKEAKGKKNNNSAKRHKEHKEPKEKKAE